MKANKLILTKGIVCAGKSSILDEYVNDENTVILSSDDLRKALGLNRNDMSVFGIIKNMANTYLGMGKTVVIDTTCLTHKRHTEFRCLARYFGVSYECHYVVTHPYRWLEQAQERIANKWNDCTMEDMCNIRKKMYQGLNFPLDWEFDNVTIHVNDIEHQQFSIEFFKQYYDEHKQLFRDNMREFFTPLKQSGYLQDVMPELLDIWGTQNRSWRYDSTLEEHTFAMCDTLSTKDETMLWAILLHNTGKVLDGIEVVKKNGTSCYSGYHGASTEIAYCVLSRLGFDESMIRNVCQIINKHTYIPLDRELSPHNVTFLGMELYKQLQIFRNADLLKK